MHALKALSQANALLAPNESPRERPEPRRASWARLLVRAGARRLAPARPAPRVRTPKPA